jgi:hypothetical protein
MKAITIPEGHDQRHTEQPKPTFDDYAGLMWTGVVLSSTPWARGRAKRFAVRLLITTLSITGSLLSLRYRIRTHRDLVDRVSSSLRTTSILLPERLVPSPVRHQNTTHSKNGEYDESNEE